MDFLSEFSPVSLGWRSQERLDIGPLYLTSPAQRLASTAMIQVKDNINQSEKSSVLCQPIRDKQPKDVEGNIKEVTAAILDFCKYSGEDDSEKCRDDEDSGIDKSDDFTQAVLNEITVSNGKSLYSF